MTVEESVAKMEVEDNMVAKGVARAALSEEADARVVERLSKGDAERAALREKRLEQEKEAADPRENVNNFNLSQQKEAEAIRAALDELMKRPPSSKDEIQKAKSSFESLRIRVLDMEKAAASASYFLSAYDVRATSDLAKDLRAKIDEVQKRVLPRKAFTFSRRKVAKEAKGSKTDLGSKPAASEGTAAQGADGAGVGPGAEVETKGQKIDGLSDTVVKLTEETAQSDDIEISNATNCTFYVLTKIAVLRLVNLTQCRVFCGPIEGSLYLEGAKDTVVMAASHQVRIHKASKTDFYLRTRSYPIIEKCSDVRFAPYLFEYAGLADHLEAAKLSEQNDLWTDVKDFGWLKSTPSPNWTILPQEERAAETYVPRNEY